MTFWRCKAPVYSLIRRLPPSRQILAAEKKNLSQLLKLFPPANGLHLDLGSGTGDSLSLLPTQPKRILLDAEISMLWRSAASPRVVARAEGLPFRSQSFTFVSAIGLLEYIDHVDEFFREVRRVLQAGGSFLFTSSPPRAANYLRLLWGEKLHFLATAQVKMLLDAQGWRLRGHRRSCLQEQWMAAPVGP